jgi:hypothetical protein
MTPPQSVRPKRRTARMSRWKGGIASRKNGTPEARWLNLPRWYKPTSRLGRVPRTSRALIAMETVAISEAGSRSRGRAVQSSAVDQNHKMASISLIYL